MPINSKYDKLVTLSPHIEMAVRRLYYRYEHKLKRFNNRTAKTIETKSPETTDFNKVIDKLKAELNSTNEIVIVHSSFSSLKHFGMSPNDMLSVLLEGLGSDVTIAMPAIPMYPNEISKKTFSEAELAATNYLYKVDSTRIWTGALPQAMIKHPDSHRSLHPLNTMVAIGPLAKPMMQNNLASETACGEHSSWNFCNRHNALIVGLGNDLTHSLTMIHLAEDAWPDSWPVRDWYQDRTFRVKNGDEVMQTQVKERRYIWGKLHFAERKLAKDLIRSKILTTGSCETVTFEHLRAKQLIDYLQSKNASAYPYYWIPKSNFK